VVICYLLFLFVRDDRCSLRRPAATGRPNIIRTYLRFRQTQLDCLPCGVSPHGMPIVRRFRFEPRATALIYGGARVFLRDLSARLLSFQRRYRAALMPPRAFPVRRPDKVRTLKTKDHLWYVKRTAVPGRHVGEERRSGRAREIMEKRSAI